MIGGQRQSVCRPRNHKRRRAIRFRETGIDCPAIALWRGHAGGEIMQDQRHAALPAEAATRAMLAPHWQDGPVSCLAANRLLAVLEAFLSLKTIPKAPERNPLNGLPKRPEARMIFQGDSV